MQSAQEKLKRALENTDLSSVESFNVDNTQKLLKICFKNEHNKFSIIYYDNKLESLKDLQQLQASLEQKLEIDNSQLDNSIKKAHQAQEKNMDNYIKRNLIIGILTVLGNLAIIPLITNLYFFSFMSFIFAVDTVGFISHLINKSVKKKNDIELLTEINDLEITKKNNVINFKRLAKSLRHVVLKVRNNVKEETNDDFEFNLSLTDCFKEEKDKILRFTI